MINRIAQSVLNKSLKSYPAVALLGPRQCGKTTLSQSFDGHYFDLEVESDRLKLDVRWTDIVNGDRLIILDEAQAYPDIFPRLRSAIDAHRKRNGRFLLLGSVAPSLMRHVSESLAGRLSLIELTPFVLDELQENQLDDLWLYGGFPDGGILDSTKFPRWQVDYLTILMQRDLPNWGLPSKPQETQRLIRMVAAVHGQIWNASQVGQSLGLNYQTVNSYMDYLTGSYLIRRLEPFVPNIRKRLIKSPKIYWRDSGLLHALLQVDDYNTLLAQPWVGASWEGFVIEQILSTLQEQGIATQPYYLRTSDQYEIDLLFRYKGKLWAIEVKLTSNPSMRDFARLEKAAELIGADKRVLVSRTTEHSENERSVSTNLTKVCSLFR
jgi:hypothetical protein